MKMKKMICIICCIVLVFTLLSGPWRAEAEAASAATIVLAIVGTFIVSAGFSFATKGEFQSATDAFMKSDAAKYVTEITGYVNDVMSLGNANNIYDLAPLITSDWFQAFWRSINDFFDKGDIVIESGTSGPSQEGYAIFNGVELPVFPDSWDSTLSALPYQLIYFSDHETNDALDFYYFLASDTPFSRLKTGGYFIGYGSGTNTLYLTNMSRTASSWGTFSRYSANSTFTLDSIIWSNSDLTEYNSSQIVFYGSVPVTEGKESIDTIPVITDSPYYNPDVVGSWVTKANEGAIDWALDSSAVYQDVTASDTTAAMTATQTGVLTEAGVEVETIDKTMGDYAVPGLASIFPFCIPFDVYNFLSVLTAEREAPHFEFLLDFGNLGSHTVEVDLSGWETVATILRTIELLGFCVGLALATSKLIKW